MRSEFLEIQKCIGAELGFKLTNFGSNVMTAPTRSEKNYMQIFTNLSVIDKCGRRLYFMIA